MNKNESKYFNTAIKMDEALLFLLEKKEFEYITIKEICNIAKVNRSTFYLHYENTYDLLKETTEYILNKHFSYYGVNASEVVIKSQKCDKKDLIFLSHEYLMPYLTFIKENKNIFKLSISKFHLMNMNEVYNKMFKYVFEPILIRFDIPINKRTYLIKFYLTGIFGIIMEWFSNDCKDDMDLIIEIINDLILGDKYINE